MQRHGIGSALAAFVTSAAAYAGPEITFSNTTFDDAGAGFGNVLQVLSLQGNDSEWGSVSRQVGSDVLSGDATPQSQTVSVADLTAASIGRDQFGLVFNINEPGSAPSVQLQEFTLVFYDAAGNTLFDSLFSPNTPLTLEPVGGPGAGTAGWRFDISFTDDQAAAFFSNPENRIGMIVPESSPILNSAAGPDFFYLVPTPGAASVLGIASLAFARRRRS